MYSVFDEESQSHLGGRPLNPRLLAILTQTLASDMNQLEPILEGFLAT